MVGVFKLMKSVSLLCFVVVVVVLAVFEYGFSVCLISFVSLVYFFVRSGKKIKNLSNGNGQRMERFRRSRIVFGNRIGSLF